MRQWGTGGEGCGVVRQVVVEGGRAKELPGLQHAHRQGGVGHLHLTGQEKAQAPAELVGLIDGLPGGKGLGSDAGEGQHPPEQRLVRSSEKGAPF